MIAVMHEDLVRRHRLTVEEYYRMAEVGLLAPDARVELIEGEIIDMPPMGIRHATILRRLTESLATAGKRANVSVQLPLRLDQFSEPVPDLALLKWRQDQYSKAHPNASDTLLVIEVSQSSLRYDCDRKLPLYARHGIPEVWIVDVAKPLLHVFHSPQDGRYAHSSSTPLPGATQLSALPDFKLDLAGLFDDL